MNLETLATELNDADAEVQLSAIRRVTETAQLLKSAELDALLRCLGASRKVIQRRAAEALAAAAAHDSRIVEKLSDMLITDDPRARWGAAYALGLIGDALDLRALPVLFETLASDDGDQRWAAAELVVRLGKDKREVEAQLLDLATQGNLNARKMALYCLRDLDGNSAPLLAVAESCCEGPHTLLKMAALSLISRVNDSVDSKQRASRLALRLLENDSDAGVRRCAAVALGHIGIASAVAVEALRHAAANDSDIFLKRSAEGALTRLEVKS